jgi:hypothetical protein
LVVVFAGCSDRRDRGGSFDAGASTDGSSPLADAGRSLDGSVDAGSGVDAAIDGGGGIDGGGLDGGSGFDAGFSDAGPRDSGPRDSGPRDSGPRDSGPRDAGPPAGGCISGASGTHVVRFRWEGTTSGSTAYVRYEANTLPDTSRWRVTAASRSIGYTPVFRDPFLGEGGLELSGTVFIDVEISTDFLPPVRNATLAIYGRSYNTTTSGSFTWQTFSGTGAAPSGSVSNVAPYRWYGADATSALPAGDPGTLLRIQAGPPSNALIVRRVEICFDAR